MLYDSRRLSPPHKPQHRGLSRRFCLVNGSSAFIPKIGTFVIFTFALSLSGGSKANDAPLLRAAAVRRLKSCAIAVLEHILASGRSNISEVCGDEDDVFDMEAVLKQIGLEGSFEAAGNTHKQLYFVDRRRFVFLSFK